MPSAPDDLGRALQPADDEIFEIQDEITQIIVSAIASHIEAAERSRTRRPSTLRSQAYGCVLQGQHIFSSIAAKTTSGPLLYEAALQVDPHYARALAAKSRTIHLDWRYDWTDGPDPLLDEALALRCARPNWTRRMHAAFGETGFVHLYRKEHDAALSAYKRACS